MSEQLEGLDNTGYTGARPEIGASLQGDDEDLRATPGRKPECGDVLGDMRRDYFTRGSDTLCCAPLPSDTQVSPVTVSMV